MKKYLQDFTDEEIIPILAQCVPVVSPFANTGWHYEIENKSYIFVSMWDLNEGPYAKILFLEFRENGTITMHWTGCTLNAAKLDEATSLWAEWCAQNVAP